jgi:hypothetical protein
MKARAISRRAHKRSPGLDGNLCEKCFENQKDTIEISSENNPVLVGKSTTNGSEENSANGGG